MRTNIKITKIHWVIMTLFTAMVLSIIFFYKSLFLGSPEKQQLQIKFYAESLGAIEKDTQEIEVQELSFFTHQMGSSYQMIILVKRESVFLPERLYLNEKGTKNLIAHSKISLSRFQSGCRESFDPSVKAKYETEFFKIDRKLSFPEKEPALKNDFLAVIVYQDKAGQRYFTQKEINKICQVMME